MVHLSTSHFDLTKYQSSLSLINLVARTVLFLKGFLAPLDLAPQIVDGLRVLNFRSDCRNHAF